MAVAKDQVVEIILTGLHALNLELDEAARFEVHQNMILFGRESALDSLSLVSLVLDVELSLRERFGVDVDLTDERAMSASRSPFRNVQSLADYVLELVGGKNG